jgi:hypothetical protein
MKTHPYLAVVRQDPRRIVELPIPDDLDRECLYELQVLAKDAVLCFMSEDDYDKAATADRAGMEIDRRITAAGGGSPR